MWHSKFVNKNKPHQVDGCTDVNIIVNDFAHYFSNSSAANNGNRAVELKEEFTCNREQYCGAPLKDELLFDVGLISNVT